MVIDGEDLDSVWAVLQQEQFDLLGGGTIGAGERDVNGPAPAATTDGDHGERGLGDAG